MGGSEEGLMVGEGEEELTVGGSEEGLMVGWGEETVGGGEEVTGAPPLKLLAWPHTGKMTKVSSCCDGRCGLIEVCLARPKVNLCAHALSHICIMPPAFYCSLRYLRFEY